MFALKFTILNSFHRDGPPQDVWTKYFNQNNEIRNYYQLTNCSVSPEDEKIFVFECQFISLEDSAIKIENKTPEFLHSLCFFDSCKNRKQKNGGAIYFSCMSPIVQDRFCSVKASIVQGFIYSGIHSYTNLLEENSSNLNIVVESCISYCGSENQQWTIYMA